MVNWKELIRKYLQSALLIVVVGVLVGVAWTLLKPEKDPMPVPSNNDATVPAFGDLFTIFFLGLPGPDARYPYRSNEPLREGKSFVTRQRVGLRVQTAEDSPSRIPIELRIVTADTKEETPSLAKQRQRFTISPGLQTYCCLTMPDTSQIIDVRVLYNGYLIGDIQNIRVTSPLH